MFARLIGASPAFDHIAFGRSGGLGKARVFPAGYVYERNTVMIADRLIPTARGNNDCEIRRLYGDRDLTRQKELSLAVSQTESTVEEKGAFSAYLDRRFSARRRLVGAVLGAWFGAFLGEHLVASLGIFVVEGLGRFQSVKAHPLFRRRGLAGALVYRVGLLALGELGTERLVIVAKMNAPAQNLYAALGFEDCEAQYGLERSGPAAG